MDIANNIFVVTGGNGFIGANLVKKLVEEGAAEIRVFDKVMRPDSEPLRSAMASGSVTLWTGDVTEPDGIAPAMEGADGLFHMAVLPLVASNQDMRASLDVNIVGGFNVFEAALIGGVRRVVYSSASSVYGDTENVMDESHPLGTRTMYGASKLAGELLLGAFGTHRNLEYVVLRYMNVYGPGQAGGLINSVLKRVSEGLPPVIFGDGTQSFDFVHVSDVAEANIAAMNWDQSGEVFNIGGDEEYSVKGVVDLVTEVTGRNLVPEYRPAPAGDVRRRVGNSGKAQRLLGYRRRVSLREGVQQLVTEGRER